MEESGAATGKKDNKQSHIGCQGECFKPCIYPSPLASDLPPITAFYHVEDLTGLASLLQQGIELCVHLQKVVYSRNTRGGGAEYEGAGSRPPVRAEGTKSGGATAQSGRSSPNKVQITVPRHSVALLDYPICTCKRLKWVSMFVHGHSNGCECESEELH